MADPSSPVPLVPATAAGLGLAALLCILGPPLVALLWRRRTGAPWRAFGWGAAVFLVFQVVLRFPWQLPLARWANGHPEWMTPFIVFSSFTAGLFEETGRWVGYRTVLRNERNPRAGAMFGLGHGGLEAILLAGLPFVGLLVAWGMAASGKLSSAPALAAIRQQTHDLGFFTAQLAVLERASAMAMHVGLALIVLQCFTRRSLGWLFLAILIHAGVDTAGVLIAGRIGRWVEIPIAALGVAVLLLGVRLA
ncbi:MAG TPA: YhfC family glutamic-type intramembrane protease, partial [Myxococcaceae bacterium]|nr:YhfC family glutamic-type intramembrane protease [Myxococcaceae bacterium]